MRFCVGAENAKMKSAKKVPKRVDSLVSSACLETQSASL
jgi:hypothetical protein